MKTTKNLFNLLISLVLILSFNACSNTEDDPKPNPNPNPTEEGNGTKEKPYSVAQAKQHQGAAANTDFKWVTGYVVGIWETKDAAGGDLYPNNVAKFDPPFYSNLNVLLADKADETATYVCVQLPATMRSVLSPKDNANVLKQKISVLGSLEKYNTMDGIKNLQDYVYDGSGGTGGETGLGLDESGAKNDPAAVAALAESFEAFTAGTGAAYFSTQTDNKGWFGYRVAGTLLADVREYSGNKFVQFSAHRNTITTAENQEFWLISPKLNLDAAASKVLNFELLGGYFNANTVFEVYVLDGLDPTAATKTKLTGFTIPTAADLGGATYTPFIPSGDIDLSAFSGEKRIGFYYKGTSGSGNSTTYELDNFSFGGGAISSLSVSPASLAFVQAGEAKTFAVTSSTTWNAVSSDPANFAVSINADVVTVTATANTTNAARTATVTVTTTDGSVTKTVALTQAGETVAGANLVVNGDFSSAWTSGVPTGWTTNPTTSVTITNGSGVLVVTNPTATTKLYQQIPVVGGTTYKLSYEYKASHEKLRLWSGFAPAAGTITGIVYLGEAATDELRTNNGYLPIATDFVTKNYTFTVPSDQTLFQLEFRYYTQASSSFELRNVSLVAQ